MRRLVLRGVALTLIVLAVVPRAQGQGDPVAAATAQGAQFLRSRAGQLGAGEAGLTALALSKAELPESDPGIQACLAKILPRFNSQGYKPERQGGQDNYEVAVACMALSSIDGEKYLPQIEALARYLLQAQNSNGSWDYSIRTVGDSSMTQYALLGLWEAESVGVKVHPRVWDAAAQFYLKTQRRSGGWVYHPDEGGAETVSMTAAGVGSLLLCQSQLSRFRQEPKVLNPFLVPLVVDDDALPKYKVVTRAETIRDAAERGVAWLRRAYNPSTDARMGPSPYYALYGVERVAALSGDSPELIRGWNWYNEGFRWVASRQNGGKWNDGQYGEVANTCWALLFATKSTAKAVRKIEIRRLGAGTLLGGRGLPTNLNDMTIAHGRVVVKPMNGAVESMIAVLEDPAAKNADAALAGLVARYQAIGADAIRPFKDRFRKLLSDPDPGVRRVSCWALGRTGDLDVAPSLIRSLLDPDDAIVAEARVGLQVLSRKLEGLGPRRGASAEEKLEAARRWRDWYESVRPPELPPFDDPALNPKAQPPANRSAETAAKAPPETPR